MEEANDFLALGISAEVEGNYEVAKDYYRAAAERYMEIAKRTDRVNNEKGYKHALNEAMEAISRGEKVKALVDAKAKAITHKFLPNSVAALDVPNVFTTTVSTVSTVSTDTPVRTTIENNSTKVPGASSAAKSKHVDTKNYTSEFDREKSLKAAKAISRAGSNTSTNSATGGSKQSQSTDGKAVTKSAKVEGKKSAKAEEELNEYEKTILNDVLDNKPGVTFQDIAGLELAKNTLQEIIIYPALRPDLFQGLVTPEKGVLFFGPPGTGKTLLAKAVASESLCTFFSITASSIVSKWLGEGEKLMKALFNVARRKQPSVIFFDEIDSIMGKRTETEHEASRRIKTEFMTQLEGASTPSNADRVLIIAATNLPWGLDEAVLRRLQKRIYIPLPDVRAREHLVRILLEKHVNSGARTIPDHVLHSIIHETVRITEGYSASDLTVLVKTAATKAVTEAFLVDKNIKKEAIRHLVLKDFVEAAQIAKPSVNPASLRQYGDWAKDFGSE